MLTATSNKMECEAVDTLCLTFDLMYLKDMQ